MGIDPSLCNTGFCVFKSNDKSEILLTGSLTSKNKGIERLIELRNSLSKILDNNIPDICVIEGYSFGSRGSRVFDIGELCGLYKITLFEKEIDFLIVPPKKLKKFATGNGNANKEKMAVLAFKKHNIEFENNDECDAFWLAKFGEAYLNKELENLKGIEIIKNGDVNEKCKSSENLHT